MKRCLSAWICLITLWTAGLLPLFAAAVDFDTETLYQSVVTVETATSLGSGFAIDETHIITNAHVVQGEKTVTVITYQEKRLVASVEKADAKQDLAVLQLQDATVPPLEAASLDTVQNGDDIYTVGAPKSMAYTLTKGIVSNRARKLRGVTYIQIDAAVNEGNSGGPLLNAGGQVIGVNTMKVVDTEGIALAIPIDRAIAFMKEKTTAPPEKASSAPSDVPPSAAPEDGRGPYFTLAVVLAVAVAVLLISNSVLIVSLVFQKNKSAVKVQRPEERTDFEIDLWE